MKVLHFLDSLGRGGAETLMLDVCLNAKKNGLNLFFIASGGGDLEKEFKKTGTHFIRLKRRFPVDPYIIFYIKRFIKKEKINIIHTHSTVAAFHAYFITLGTKVKRVHTVHGYDVKAFRRDNFVLKILFSHFHLVFAVSKGFQDRISKQMNIKRSKNFYVLHNGINLNKFILKEKYNLRRELNIKENSVLLGSVGNFYFESRDQLTICKALPILFILYPDVHFIFVGGRSASNPILFDQCVQFCSDNNISERVHFTGIRKDIANILSSLDIFIFSSLEDTFGIAAVEAMAMGLPTVLSNIPPFREISDNGKYAKLFETKDDEHLAEILIQLIKNKEERIELGKQGQKWVKTTFSIDAHISKLKSFYIELLKQ